MKRRVVGAVAVLTLVAGLLSSCRTNVGTAATVGSQRISESTVGDYVLAAGPSAEARQQAAANGATLSPKSSVLAFLLQRELYRQLLARTPAGVPSAGDLTAVRDQALQVLAQAQTTGSAAETQLRTALQNIGIQGDFVAVYFEALELEYTFVQRERIADQAALTTVIDKAKITVRVNPRYGTWDASTAQLNGKASLPSYLTLQTTAAAQPAS